VGQVDIKIKQPGDLAVRIAEWVRPDQVRVQLNGEAGTPLRVWLEDASGVTGQKKVFLIRTGERLRLRRYGIIKDPIVLRAEVFLWESTRPRPRPPSARSSNQPWMPASRPRKSSG